MGEYTHEVFISYSSYEKQEADLVKDTLENEGITCWMAPDSIPAGSTYPNEIFDGIIHARVFVLVLSKQSMNSKWVSKEVDLAINNDKVIIPFHIDDCQLNPTFNFYLNNIQRIDAYKRVREALDKLIERVNGILGKATADKKVELKSNHRIPVYNMVGRERELAQISEGFRNYNIICLTGIGGIGKSEIAKRYILDSVKNERYKTICFVNYRGNLLETIATMEFDNFNEKKFIEQLQKQDEKVEISKESIIEELYNKKLSWLQGYGKEVLIVIDGLDDNKDKHFSSLETLHCDVLISTRCTFSKYFTISVDRIDDIGLLEKLFFSYYKDGNSSFEELKSVIDEIINEVNGHTLTIKLVGQLLETSGYEPEYLLEVLRNNKEIILNDRIEHNNEYGTIFNHIANLFDIVNITESEKFILSCLSLIPSNGIRKYVFRQWSELNSLEDVQRLIDKGWIESGKGLIALHPIISLVISKKIKPDTKTCGKFIENFMNDLVPIKMVNMMQKQHMREIGEFMATRLTELNALTCKFYTKLGKYIDTLTYQNMFIINDDVKSLTSFIQFINEDNINSIQFKKALDYLQKALAIYNNGNISENYLAEVYNGFGSAYFNMSVYREAMEYHRKAAMLREKLLGRDNEDTMTSFRRLGTSLYYLKNYEEALKHYENNLKVRLSNCKPNDLMLSRSYSYVGMALKALGRSEEAYDHFKKALMILEEHPEEVIGIGELYSNLGDIIKISDEVTALDYYRKAHTSFKKLYDDSNRRVKAIKEKINQVYRE